MRLLCAAAVSLALGLYVSNAGATKADRAEKFTAIKKHYDEELADFKKRLEKAADRNEANGIQAEIRELVALTADKVLVIIKDDPKDDTSYQAAEFILKAAGGSSAHGLKDVDAVIAVLAENHVGNPKIKGVLLPAMRAGPAGDKLLLAVSEKSPDKEAKGLALYFRGFKAARAADDEDDDKELAASIAKATDLLEKAAAEAPDLKVGNSGKTISELAKQDIAGMKKIVIVANGKPAPETESYSLDGKKVKLSDFKGKVVLFDIWATWCGPCRAMIPHERELVKRMKDKPFVLVSLSVDDEKDTLRKFLDKEAMPWVHWWDEGQESLVLKKYRIRGFPSLFLIDHSGVVREKWIGVPDNDKLDKAVEELVKEAEKAKG